MRKNRIIAAGNNATYWADIFIGGSYETAVEACRDFCMDGLCVSVSPCDFVFTGGMESGVRIGLIRYPRFPHCSDEDINERAEELARFLIERLHQQSCTIVNPKETWWYSRRDPS